MYKFDSGDGFASNCFPARFFHGETTSGSWLVVKQMEEQERVNQTAPQLTYQDIKLRRKLAEEHGLPIQDIKVRFVQDHEREESDIEKGHLNRAFIYQVTKVKKPNDIIHLDVSASHLGTVNPDDLSELVNTVSINAGENTLHFTDFKSVPNLQKLSMPMNGISRIVYTGEYNKLSSLDLSYNCLTAYDVEELSFLPNLVKLDLSGNELKELPEPWRPTYKQSSAFTTLEKLILNDNNLNSDECFLYLASLTRLKSLSMQHNEISVIPSIEFDGRRHFLQTRGENDVLENLEHTAMNDGLTDRDEDAKLTRFMLPPFVEVESFDLSYNNINDDQHLLALSTWSNLTRLTLIGNPIVTQKKQETPIIKELLRDQLNIDVIKVDSNSKFKSIPLHKQHQMQPFSMESGALAKTTSAACRKKNRKVTAKILPVPKCNVEQLMLTWYDQSKYKEPSATKKDEETSEKANVTEDDNGEPQGEEDEPQDGGFFMTELTTTTENKPPKPTQAQEVDTASVENAITPFEMDPFDEGEDEEVDALEMVGAEMNDMELYIDTIKATAEKDAKKLGLLVPQDPITCVSELRRFLKRPLLEPNPPNALPQFKPKPKSLALPPMPKPLTMGEKVGVILNEQGDRKTIDETPLQSTLNNETKQRNYLVNLKSKGCQKPPRRYHGERLLDDLQEHYDDLRKEKQKVTPGTMRHNVGRVMNTVNHLAQDQRDVIATKDQKEADVYPPSSQLPSRAC